MIELKDEVLDTAGQSVEVPLFNIKDENGVTIHSKVQIELDTPVIQEGNNLNKAFWEEIGFHAGMILMWSGTIATIPIGWVLCDGNNGTPDLRNRFIVGAGSTYPVGNKGGSDTVTLTEVQIPNHTHGISTDGAHTHKYTGYSNHVNHGGTANVDSPYGQTNKNTDSQGGHTHTISNAGGGGAHENRPPYYALAYIMKI